MKREDTYYEAMRARDPRFDGKFFVGVKTTGIYCRPLERLRRRSFLEKITMEQVQKKIRLSIGPVYLVASEKGLQGVFWKEQKIPITTGGSKNPILKKTELQLEEFLIGKRKDFDLR